MTELIDGKKFHILIVEDDRPLAGGLCRALQNEKTEAVSCHTLHEAEELLDAAQGNRGASMSGEGAADAQSAYDLVILDVNLPDGNGFDFLQQIKAKYDICVIMLTANDMETDIVAGLEAGADDYITKPFSMDELLARISAHLRREERKGTAENLRFDEELIIDYNSRTVFYGKEQLDFSNKEFEIIRFLSQNAGMVFDRETIYEKLWGYNGEGDSIVVKEHIRKIRNKLSVYTDKNYIETVWGVGYKWAK